jgi:feruloyl-CoA synthase
MSRAHDIPVRNARMLPPETIIRPGPDGVLYARSPTRLGPFPVTLTERLEHWAAAAPDRTFLAARDASGHWRRLSYADMLAHVRGVAQALLDRRLSADRPLVILSGNSLEHAIMAYAAMFAGVTHAPVAPAYSLVSRDYRTLAAVITAMRPGLLFAKEGARFERALARLPGDPVELVTCEPVAYPGPVTAFDELLATPSTSAVDAAHAAIGPDAIAKILFTSGSTGSPKGVINTQRMLCANQEQLRTVMTFLADEPPVLCDWLPWNHTFGGNHNVGIALYNGGTLYIDDGKPAPGAFDVTVQNLRDVATTAYFNVPKGYEMLLGALEGDAAFARHFFSRLQILFYAAAGLRQDTADAIEDLAVQACGARIPWVTGLGATESAPFALCTGPMPVPVAGRIGVPVPGVELKVVPAGSRREARVRGPNITPGYWRDEPLTAAAFDVEGFYRLGDAVGFVDPADPSRGFVFEGRITEDFKLSTGTWVRVGPLRAALLAECGPVVHDLVVAGHDRDDVRLLVFPAVPVCRQLCARPAASADEIVDDPLVRETIERRLAAFNVRQAGSSTRVARAVLLAEPPSLDAREVTDKGSLNQRAVLERRAALVEQLFASDGPTLLIDLHEGT